MAVDIGPALGLTADSKSLVVATEELKDLAAAAKQAQGAAQQFSGGADKMAVAAGRAADATEDAALASRQLGPGMAAGGGQARMLAQQLSQVAQQASATGNFVQALAIQLPDMTLGFGAAGIAAGVLASVALPVLVGWLTNTGASATATTEALNALAEAQRDTQSQIDQLRLGASEQYQVDLINEQVRLTAEYNTLLAERTRIAATFGNDERARTDYLTTNNAELQKIVDRYNEISAALSQQQNRSAQLAVLEGIKAQKAAEVAAKQRETAEEAEKVDARLRAAGISAETLASMNFANIDQARAFAEGLERALASSAAYAAELGNSGQSSGPDSARSLSQFGGGRFAPVVSGAGRADPKPSGGGGGGGGTDQRQTQLETLIESLRTERETVEAWRAEQLELLAQYSDAELQAIGGANEAKLRLEEEFQERLRGITSNAANYRLQETSDMFGALASIAEAGGKKALKGQAVLSAASTMIAGYEAAMKAAAEAKTIPGRIAAYAKFVGLAVSSAAQIRQAGGVSGGGGSGRGSSAPAQAAPSSPVNVSIAGLNADELYSGSSVIALVDAVQKELKNRGAIISFV